MIIQKTILICLLSCVLILQAAGQDWEGIPVPADAGEGHMWQLQEDVSDRFNYTAEAADKGDTFNTKWKDSYVNAWTGGSNTTWTPDQSYVDGSMLVLDANRKPETTDEVIAGCISARQTVEYPVFIETNAKLSTSVLASCFWMISLDQTQEIDIIEAFGTDRPGKAWYNTRQHLSHHVFIRVPFTDYQPTDQGSWYTDGTIWSEDFHRVGVYWKDSLHLEYYIDGQMVRVVHDKAFANWKNNKWTYSTAVMEDGVLVKEGGYQVVETFATSDSYSFETLQEASNSSDVSVIDAYGYTEHGLTRPQYMVVSTAQQSWTSMEATDDELEDKEKAIYQLDWIRVYKPVLNTGLAQKRAQEFETSIYPQPCTDRVFYNSSQVLNQVDICTFSGARIKSEKVEGTSGEISCDGLPGGMYILKMHAENGGISSRKMIKM